ncbi:MAG TPA: hypothetical protein VNF47_09280 [Streptosporangiaceae bacterium]|nr:hypothetical protein [Streptosporangiaceae bacterium]
MIVAAALCPAPPLLVRELTGTESVLPELRQACLAAAAELAACAPDAIVVVGPAEQTGEWDPRTPFDLTAFAPGLSRHAFASTERPASAGSEHGQAGGLPAALGIGAWLLAAAGYQGRSVLTSVAHDEPTRRCAEIGAGFAAAPERLALLVLADGSARRGLKAPGYLDERSAGFDAAVEHALRTADPGALLEIDSELAASLMATGRPAWQVLAGALGGHPLTSEIRYSDDPFGVAYLVASLRPWPRTDLT